MIYGYVSPADVASDDRPRDHDAWEAVVALHAAGRLRIAETCKSAGGNVYLVQLVGEDAIPLAYVAYDDEAGLYDRRLGRPGTW